MTYQQQTENPPSAPNTYFAPPTPSPTGNGLGVAALVLGILALIGAFIPFVNYVSGLPAVVGIVLGAIALGRKGRKKGAALVGLITSVIALVLSIVLAIAYTAGFVNAVNDSMPKASAKTAQETNTSGSADPASPAVGTRENPAALGTTIELISAGAVQYEVKLGAPTLNANDAVAAENQFNEAPPAGLQYAVVPVTVVYKGTETGTPWMDVQIEFVSAAGTTHTPSDASVVGPKPQLMDINDLYPNATGTGNVVIAIPTADAEKGTWAVSALFGDKFFFTAK